MWVEVSVFNKVCQMRSRTVMNLSNQKDLYSTTPALLETAESGCMLWTVSDLVAWMTISHNKNRLWQDEVSASCHHILKDCHISFTQHEQGHFTWFHFQGATVDLDVKPFRCCITEVFKHAVHSFCDVIRYRLVQFHPAVHHHTPIPEVENFQLLKSSQIGL